MRTRNVWISQVAAGVVVNWTRCSPEEHVQDNQISIVERRTLKQSRFTLLSYSMKDNVRIEGSPKVHTFRRVTKPRFLNRYVGHIFQISLNLKHPASSDTAHFSRTRRSLNVTACKQSGTLKERQGKKHEERVSQIFNESK